MAFAVTSHVLAPPKAAAVEENGEKSLAEEDVVARTSKTAVSEVLFGVDLTAQFPVKTSQLGPSLDDACSRKPLGSLPVRSTTDWSD